MNEWWPGLHASGSQLAVTTSFSVRGEEAIIEGLLLQLLQLSLVTCGDLHYTMPKP